MKISLYTHRVNKLPTLLNALLPLNKSKSQDDIHNSIAGGDSCIWEPITYASMGIFDRDDAIARIIGTLLPNLLMKCRMLLQKGTETLSRKLVQYLRVDFSFESHLACCKSTHGDDQTHRFHSTPVYRIRNTCKLSSFQ